MNKQIERQIIEIYNQVYRKVFNKTNCDKLADGSTDDVLNTIVKLQSSDQFNEFCKTFAKELAKKGLANQRGIWRKYYQAAKSQQIIALYPTYNSFEYQMMVNAVNRNFKIIKSIPDEMTKIINHKYTSTLINEVINGKLPRGSLQKELAKHGVKNAKMIARTETAKIQSTILEDRATSLGSIAYIWKASHDVRTRPSHKEMDGVLVLWMDNIHKPLRDGWRGNPGEFVNCRCDMEPIFSIKDLTKSSYKVYNFNNDKIESMTRSQTIKFIETKGEQK